MRDKGRIKVVLRTIEEIWKDNPNLRLGQLLCNAVPESWIYYIEDDQLLDAICKFYGYGSVDLDGDVAGPVDKKIDGCKDTDKCSVVEALDEMIAMAEAMKKDGDGSSGSGNR